MSVSHAGDRVVHVLCAAAGPVRDVLFLRSCGIACLWLVDRSRAGLQWLEMSVLSLLEASAAGASGIPVF